MTLRAVANPEPFIACILAAGEAQDRLAALYPPAAVISFSPSRLRPHPNPAKRRNSPERVYGLAHAELPEWRWLMSNKSFTAMEAANVVLRSRRGQ